MKKIMKIITQIRHCICHTEIGEVDPDARDSKQAAQWQNFISTINNMNR